MGGPEMAHNLVAGSAHSNAQHTHVELGAQAHIGGFNVHFDADVQLPTAHEAAHVAQQGAVHLDPAQRLAKVAVDQAEAALDVKQGKKKGDKDEKKDPASAARPSTSRPTCRAHEARRRRRARRDDQEAKHGDDTSITSATRSPRRRRTTTSTSRSTRRSTARPARVRRRHARREAPCATRER